MERSIQKENEVLSIRAWDSVCTFFNPTPRRIFRNSSGSAFIIRVTMCASFYACFPLLHRGYIWVRASLSLNTRVVDDAKGMRNCRPGRLLSVWSLVPHGKDGIGSILLAQVGGTNIPVKVKIHYSVRSPRHHVSFTRTGYSTYLTYIGACMEMSGHVRHRMCSQTEFSSFSKTLWVYLSCWIRCSLPTASPLCSRSPSVWVGKDCFEPNSVFKDLLASNVEVNSFADTDVPASACCALSYNWRKAWHVYTRKKGPWKIGWFTT
jgi:hypothetical protein